MKALRNSIAAFVVSAMMFVCAPFARADQNTLVTPGSPLTMTGLASFLNNGFVTVGSLWSGATAPATFSGGTAKTYQFWLDTSTTPKTLRINDGAVWVAIGTLDPVSHVFAVSTSVGLPGPSTLGGVFSLAATSNNFLTGLGTDGNFTRAQPSISNLSGFGTGVAAALAINTGSAGAPVLFNGALGTPSSGTATNLTGLPISTGVSGLGTGIAAFLATPSSANLATAVTDETGTGPLVFGTSPSLTTPNLGVASATSINKVTITAPATGSTLTIADGKTLTASNSIGIAGTDGTVLTGPSTNATLAALNINDQTLAGGANVTSLSQSTGSITVDCGARPLQYITNGGAFTITAPSNDGTCILLITNNGSAGAITFSGFTVGSNVGDAFTTTNTSKFMLWVGRINGTASYSNKALQ